MKFGLCAIIVLLPFVVNAQTIDSLSLQKELVTPQQTENKAGNISTKPGYLGWKKITLPAAMVVYGLLSLEIEALKNADLEVQEKILKKKFPNLMN